MSNEHTNQGIAPTSKELRRLMATVLPDDAIFDAFCLDNFPAVHGRFAGGMDRTRKENLLFTTAAATNILAVLRGDYADKVAEYERLNHRAGPVPPDLANISGSELPPRDRCIGREQELEWLVSEILAPPPRALMLLGPPGIGKTTLTITALHAPAIEQQFQSRRYFVRLESAATREQTVAAFIRDLGLRPASDPWKAILSMLRTATALLVLDNLETPWDGTERSAIEQLLAELGDISTLVLVGSIKGYRFPDRPHHRNARRLGPLTPQSAHKLFCEVASDVDPQSAAIDTLLQGQGGNPLAIKLVASMAQGAGNIENVVKLWQHEGISDEVKTFELAIASPRLTEEARQLLQVVAWLPAGLHPLDRDALMPSEGLKAEVCLTQAALCSHEGERLQVHPAIRNYVRHQHPPTQQLQDSIRTHYYGLTQQLGARIGFRDGEGVMERLLAEADNLDMLIQSGLKSQSVQEAIKAVVALRDVMRLSARGPLSSLYSCLNFASQSKQIKATADCARIIGEVTLTRSQHEEARRRYQQALSLYQQVGDILGQADCIFGLGNIALMRSQHEEARERYQQALLLFRQVGDIQGQANCILGLGDIALACSQHEEARECYQQALLLYRQVGYILGQANCIWSLGVIALARSQHEEAQESFQQVLPFYRQVGYILGQANCIFCLGYLALVRSQHEEARGHFQQVLPLFQQVGSIISQANCIASLGDLALMRSQHEEAREHYQQALLLFQQVGSIPGQANCIFGLGNLALARSQHEEAQERFQQVLPLYQQIGFILGQANCLASLGSLALMRSQHEEAREHFQQALTLYQQIGSILGEANCIASLGDLAFERSQHEEVREYYQQALKLYQQVGFILGQARCIKGLGDIALERSQHEEVREYYQQALRLYQQVGFILGQARCIKDLGYIALERSQHEEAREYFQQAFPLFQQADAIQHQADCILGLGDIALARSQRGEAHSLFNKALSLYLLIPEPYSIGCTHHRLARIAPTAAARQEHVSAAREAWTSIGFLHLVENLDKEFGSSVQE